MKNKSLADSVLSLENETKLASLTDHEIGIAVDVPTVKLLCSAYRAAQKLRDADGASPNGRIERYDDFEHEWDRLNL